MILIIDNKSKFVKDLCKVVRDLKVNYELVDKAAPAEMLPKDHSIYSGLILSGGPMHFDRKLYLEDVSFELASLMEMEDTTPTLGICLGHQLLGEVFDGRIKHMDKAIHITDEEVNIIEDDILFKDIPKKIKVQESHSDEIIKLPHHFKLLAYSSDCDVEAMRHETRPTWGVQFHPEASGEVGKKIIENFLRICGEVK